MGELRDAYKILVGKPTGKRPLGRPRRILEENIRMNLTEIGWEGVEQWHDKRNTVMNSRVT
jgi:hypothetical protein